MIVWLTRTHASPVYSEGIKGGEWLFGTWKPRGWGNRAGASVILGDMERGVGFAPNSWDASAVYKLLCVSYTRVGAIASAAPSTSPVYLF